jgi:hypothetical protein
VEQLTLQDLSFPQAGQADEPIVLNDVERVQRGKMKRETEK